MHDLTEDQIAAFEIQLRALRAELVTSLADERTQTVALGSEQGRVSRVDAYQQQQMALAEKRRNEHRIRAVDGALERIAEDDFGFCVRCGDSIAFKRLKVRPEGAMCLPCTQKLGG